MSGRTYLCTTDLYDDPVEVAATDHESAAEIHAGDTDEDCVDCNSCDVYVREHGAAEWRVYRVMTRVEVRYEARDTGRRRPVAVDGDSDDAGAVPAETQGNG